MIDLIPSWALKNRFLVLTLAALLVGVGVYSAKKLPIDAVPDVTNVQVTINTNAPALSPLEIEQQITFTIEQVLKGIPGVEQVRSISALRAVSSDGGLQGRNRHLFRPPTGGRTATECRQSAAQWTKASDGAYRHRAGGDLFLPTGR